MTTTKKSQARNGAPPKGGYYFYDYSEETLIKYVRTSTKRKLNLLHEISQLTNTTFAEKEKIFRDRIRRGEF